mgnify:CR=1 FL=1
MTENVSLHITAPAADRIKNLGWDDTFDVVLAEIVHKALARGGGIVCLAGTNTVNKFRVVTPSEVMYVTEKSDGVWDFSYHKAMYEEDGGTPVKFEDLLEEFND